MTKKTNSTDEITTPKAKTPKRVTRTDPAETPAPDSVAKHKQRLTADDRKVAEGAQRKIEARLLIKTRRQHSTIRQLRGELKEARAKLAAAEKAAQSSPEAPGG